jgi:hypothetical protein
MGSLQESTISILRVGAQKMDGQFVFSYLVFWSLVGAVLFSVFVVFVFRSGIVYASRKEDGTLKEHIPWRGIVAMATFLVAIVGFFVAANTVGLALKGISVDFIPLFLLNLAHYLILFLFDTFFIDAFVLGYWQPDFLKLSEQMGRESMREHILVSLPVGTVFGIFLAGLSTVISYFFIIR